MTSLWLAMALLAVAGGDGLRLEGSVAAGGGYDASLLLAPGGGASGSAVATVGASGGAALDVSDDVSLYLGARLDGATFPGLPALDRTGAGAEASLLWRLAGPVALVLAPAVAWSWYADPARSGAAVAGRVTLRVKPLPWLVVRAGYAHQLRTAADPVHASDLDRVFAGAELLLSPGTWVALTGSADRGDQTFYREPSPPPGGTAPVPAALEPYRAPATGLAASLGVDRELGAGLSLSLALTLQRVSTPAGSWSGPSAHGALAWRWD
jgi:hypothetical protein